MAEGRPAWAAGAGGCLLAIYAATLAPSVTFWDAGEFIAAARTLGIPHPPGTPLWVLIAHLWTLLPISGALALSCMSAVFTAGAFAVLAWLVGRWTGWWRAGAAAALCAGTMSSVWLNATETEVYAASLLLSALMLLAADAAGRSDDGRRTALVAYLVALSVPLHLSALVAAPAAIVLASYAPDGSVRWRRAAALGAVFALTQAVGTLQLAPALAAGGLVAIALWLRRRRAERGVALGASLAAGALAVSALLAMYLRAQHDPLINQGDPSTLARSLDVIGRRQYAVVGLWPRRAPVWLQLANVVQYADWQTALSLGPDALPSVGRSLGTLVFVALGIHGSREHRRQDRRSWCALVVLLLCGTLGAATQLNLAAGASIGWGILADWVPHEARDRDYFFVLGFVAWGLWAGIGAVRLIRSRVGGPLGTALGLALAGAPIPLNWTAVTRRAEPDAALPGAVARALLEGAPPRAVLVVAGDNDTYPLWEAQSRGVRPDVTVVTASLLPAAWYRAELARRDSLGVKRGWFGEPMAVSEVARAAEVAARPLALSAALIAGDREAIGGEWDRRGLLVLRPGTVESEAGRAAALAVHALARRPLRAAADPATRAWLAQARCGVDAVRMAPRPSTDGRSGLAPGTPALLDSTCGGR